MRKNDCFQYCVKIIIILLQVSLWKEGLDGEWVCIDDVKKTEVTEEAEKQGQQGFIHNVTLNFTKIYNNNIVIIAI